MDPGENEFYTCGCIKMGKNSTAEEAEYVKVPEGKKAQCCKAALTKLEYA